MAPLMNLPLDVLQTIPWDESDLSSVILTCRLFHQLFTPRFYENFTAEEEDLDTRRPYAGWHRGFSFLRTIRNNPTLATLVRELSLTLREVDFWDHEEFRLIACDFGVAADFNIVALPADPNCPNPIKDTAPEEGSQQQVIYQGATIERSRQKYCSNRAIEGHSYSSEQFLKDYTCTVLSKLPQLRRLSLTYDRIKLFDRFSHFAHLEEVEIGSMFIPFKGDGDELFEYAVRLLGLPKIRRWSLSCAEMSESAIRCIPPQSSPVQEMSISCPHIPAREFRYLMAIPRALKVFLWRLKTWTCYPLWEGAPPVYEQRTEVGRDVDDGDPGSGNHHEDTVDSESEWATECQTLSSASMFSCLRRLQTSLEEISVEYAFVGSCSHADARPCSLHEFANLKKLSVSPQILRGFHRCTSQETCVNECTHLHRPRQAVSHLPNLERLDLWMQVDGDKLADLVTHVSSGISTLREIVLHSTVHLDDTPDIEYDSARKYRPMTTKRYYDLYLKCDSQGVSLVSCCYEACLEEILESAQGLVHSDQIPSDMAPDESAAAQSWQEMHSIAQSMMILEAISCSNQSELSA